ncbi:nucleoside recognition domain-containing protein [Gloeothece verrucosa]|uniref:Nucleoside recognition domain protein n=1 Tax=Gloeothece verrucosa (strain PCC 7822) TaxID=497965 RepID=E0UE31_GLOV7|nr:nucleoside recognition domain-containing protein [Gloeothece verrucosa]ADN13035.1 nucleoside recognition domain protein [Gloeothece verrucosa PCC 7822]
MLNYIWFGIIFISVIVGSFTGNIDKVTEAAISSAETAVEIAIGLIGTMALWLGVMKIAEESGLVHVIAKVVKPITVRLFPDVPPEHPAMGSIVLNMSANVLGLGNAATPLGLKAMQELQELNPRKDTATNAMCMFLAINTSSVQLILPAQVVALMKGASSEIFLPTILATGLSTTSAIISAIILSKMKRFKLEPVYQDFPLISTSNSHKINHAEITEEENVND